MRGKTPIIVGGTGFYLNTLLSNEPTAPASTAVDKQYVEQLVASKTWDQRCYMSLQIYRMAGRFGKLSVIHQTKISTYFG